MMMPDLFAQALAAYYQMQVSELREAIALHRKTIDSPASPELAGIVDKRLWEILDQVPEPTYRIPTPEEQAKIDLGRLN